MFQLLVDFNQELRAAALRNPDAVLPEAPSLTVNTSLARELALDTSRTDLTSHTALLSAVVFRSALNANKRGRRRRTVRGRRRRRAVSRRRSRGATRRTARISGMTRTAGARAARTGATGTRAGTARTESFNIIVLDLFSQGRRSRRERQQERKNVNHIFHRIPFICDLFKALQL